MSSQHLEQSRILEKALAYIAGYGMKAVIIAQALNQIRKNYGDKSSIFDNCATTVFYAPTPLIVKHLDKSQNF